MKKSTLKLVVFSLAFVLIGAIPYFKGTIPRGVEDALGLFMVMAILTAMETNALGVFLSAGSSDLIPRCIKTVIGVVMLLGLVSILQQSGGFSTGFFDDPILQLPITPVDVSVLVIIGTTLYWAGGLMYQTVTKVTISIGNLCYYILGKTGLVELEDDGEEGEMVKETIHEARELVSEFRRDLSIAVGDPESEEQEKAYQPLLKSLDMLDECLKKIMKQQTYRIKGEI